MDDVMRIGGCGTWTSKADNQGMDGVTTDVLTRSSVLNSQKQTDLRYSIASRNNFRLDLHGGFSRSRRVTLGGSLSQSFEQTIQPSSSHTSAASSIIAFLPSSTNSDTTVV
jgi:hypothetical protein